MVEKTVTIASVTAKGSRLPSDSIVRLAQLRPAMNIDEKANISFQ